jgi:hypothetical protein
MVRRPQRVLRPRGWLVGVVATAAAVFLAGAVSSFVSTGWTWVTVAFVVLTVIGVVGLAEVGWSRVVIRDAALEVHTLWQYRRFTASQVAAVTWEAGCGVALKLSDGTWAKLPDLGYNAQGLTNTIRAWLKRAKSAEA